MDESDFTYPTSRRIVMAELPEHYGEAEPMMARDSVSWIRMNTLFHDWPDQAIGVNCWWYADDILCRRPSRLEQILRETGCEIIIALGVHVQRELGLSPRDDDTLPYSRHTITFEERSIEVIRFPHPSKRNRHWRHVPNRVLAADTLKAALLS